MSGDPSREAMTEWELLTIIFELRSALQKVVEERDTLMLQRSALADYATTHRDNGTLLDAETILFDFTTDHGAEWYHKFVLDVHEEREQFRKELRQLKRALAQVGYFKK